MTTITRVLIKVPTLVIYDVVAALKKVDGFFKLCKGSAMITEEGIHVTLPIKDIPRVVGCVCDVSQQLDGEHEYTYDTTFCEDDTILLRVKRLEKLYEYTNPGIWGGLA